MRAGVKWNTTRLFHPHQLNKLPTLRNYVSTSHSNECTQHNEEFTYQHKECRYLNEESTWKTKNVHYIIKTVHIIINIVHNLNKNIHSRSTSEVQTRDDRFRKVLIKNHPNKEKESVERIKRRLYLRLPFAKIQVRLTCIIEHMSMKEISITEVKCSSK